MIQAAWQLEDAFQDIRIDVYPDTNEAQTRHVPCYTALHGLQGCDLTHDLASPRPKAREAHFQFVTDSGRKDPGCFS